MWCFDPGPGDPGPGASGSPPCASVHHRTSKALGPPVGLTNSRRTQTNEYDADGSKQTQKQIMIYIYIYRGNTDATKTNARHIDNCSNPRNTCTRNDGMTRGACWLSSRRLMIENLSFWGSGRSRAAGKPVKEVAPHLFIYIKGFPAARDRI